MGTGFAIGKPGEPVEYIVTNGHVVEYGYMGIPKYMRSKYLRQACRYTSLQRKMIMLQAEVVYYSASNEKDIAIIKIAVKDG